MLKLSKQSSIAPIEPLWTVGAIFLRFNLYISRIIYNFAQPINNEDMYDQIREEIIYLMVYSAVTALNLVACCYLLFRRANAIVPSVTSPVRLRRWTAAFMGASTLSHLWFMPLIYLTDTEAIKTTYFVGTLLDLLTVFPLSIAILFTMLQDRRRPLWPIAVMMAPLVIGITVCIATSSDAFLPVIYTYYLLMIVGLVIYFVRATRQYGRWLRDNYADLEHKEVWQSLVVLAIILSGFCLYTFEIHDLFFKYAMQFNGIILVSFLVWRVESLSDLSINKPQSIITEREELAEDKIGPLLQRHCIETRLYLQYDLSAQQLCKAIGTNRYYLSQYFSRKGLTYNAYINGLRIDYFISRYQQAVADRQQFTLKQLALDSGFRNYSTFSNAFKQRTGKSVTTWMQDYRGERAEG